MKKSFSRGEIEWMKRFYLKLYMKISAFFPREKAKSPSEKKMKNENLHNFPYEKSGLLGLFKSILVI